MPRARAFDATRFAGVNGPSGTHLALAAGTVCALALGGCGNRNGDAPPAGNGSPPAAAGCAYVGLNQALTARLPGPEGATYSIVDLPEKGQLTLTNPMTGEFTYSPNTNARGEDRLRFQTHNGDESSDVALFRLVYTPRLMPLGDSITWGGSGDQDPRRLAGYRKPLHDELRRLGYHFDFVGTLASGQDAGLAGDPDHEGHGGWRADQLVDGHANPPGGTGSGRLSEWLETQAPDVVLLHAGTNDLNGAGDPAAEANDIDRILATVNDWEPDHWPVTVVVARIIVNHQAPQERTSAFNDAVEAIAARRIGDGDEVIWVDHETRLDRDDHYADDLHPNEAGYARMAEVWLHPLAGEGIPTGSHAGGGILARCP